jgi:hypothetical protein
MVDSPDLGVERVGGADHRVQGRYRRMRELDDIVCPESKVTPEMSRDRALNMPVTGVFIDEVQVPLEDRTPITVEGKKLTAGEYMGRAVDVVGEEGSGGRDRVGVGHPTAGL